MRTSPQHFASREVVARILSLEDVCPEARCSHRPGADRRVLSSLSCHTSVSVKQQLAAADSERSSSRGLRAQLLEQAVLSPAIRPTGPPRCPGPGKSPNRGDSTAPHGKTRNTPGFNFPLSPGSASSGPSARILWVPSDAAPLALPRPCAGCSRPAPACPSRGKAVALLALDSPGDAEIQELAVCGPGRSLPPRRGVHVLGSVCFCLQLCLIGNSTL